MMHVTIYTVDKDAQQREVGRIMLKHGGIALEGDKRRLQRLLDSEVHDEQWKVVRPDSEPEKFLRMLARKYRSVYLTAVLSE